MPENVIVYSHSVFLEFFGQFGSMASNVRASLITMKFELGSKVMEILVVIVCSELQIVLSGKKILTNPSKKFQ